MKAIKSQNQSNLKQISAMLFMLLFLCSSVNVFAKNTENSNPTDVTNLTAAELDQSDILTVNDVILYSISIPQGEYIKFSIFDTKGVEMKVLIDSDQTQGSVVLDLGNANLKNGTYYYKLIVGNYKEVKKITYSK